MDSKSTTGKYGKWGEREGVHSWRLFDIALFDAIPTIIAAYLIAVYFEKPFWKVMLVVFLIGVLAHRMFDVRTTVDRIVFP